MRGQACNACRAFSATEGELERAPCPVSSAPGKNESAFGCPQKWELQSSLPITGNHIWSICRTVLCHDFWFQFPLQFPLGLGPIPKLCSNWLGPYSFQSLPQDRWTCWINMLDIHRAPTLSEILPSALPARLE